MGQLHLQVHEQNNPFNSTFFQQLTVIHRSQRSSYTYKYMQVHEQSNPFNSNLPNNHGEFTTHNQPTQRKKEMGPKRRM